MIVLLAVVALTFSATACATSTTPKATSTPIAAVTTTVSLDQQLRDAQAKLVEEQAKAQAAIDEYDKTLVDSGYAVLDRRAAQRAVASCEIQIPAGQDMPTQEQVNAAMGLLIADSSTPAIASEYAGYYIGRDSADSVQQKKDVELIQAACRP